jgi:uncharacterized protein (TIGR02594 family)
VTPVPAAYAYLNHLVGAPHILTEALALYGVHEAPGEADNPVILAWSRELGLADYRHDSTAWCGLFAAVVVRRAGYTPVAAPLWALNWRTFGQVAGVPSIGDVLAFSRPGGGHVGIYVAHDAHAYHVLGGNTADAVSIARIDKSRLVAARRPVWRVAKPSGVIPYELTGHGALSENEA